MRFLMVTSFFPPHNFGGDGIYVRQLSGALAARGHDVTVVYSYDAYRISGGTQPCDAVDSARPAGLRVLCLKSRLGALSPLISHQTGTVSGIPEGLSGILAEDFDVVHFHNVSLIGGPDVLRLGRGRHKLITAHDHWLVCPTHILWKNGSRACDGRTCLSCQILSRKPPQLWRYGGRLERALQHVDLILSPSRFTLGKLREAGISRPIAVEPLFAPRAFERLADMPRAEVPTFIYAGRVTASKGVDRFARLMRRRPGYRFEIVGDGELAPRLEAEFADAPNVALLGRSDQAGLARLYRRATAAVLPSLAPETFGLTTIEAFSQGTPVIVRDAGGAGEAVRETGAGIVYRTDEDALAAMDALVADPGRRDTLGRRARAAFLGRFTEARHIDAYLDRIAGRALDREDRVHEGDTSLPQH